jgi:ABC-type oligopeptide transport system substrate-binding subunit
LPWNFPRHNPLLVQVVEELGVEVNTWASKLCIKQVSGPYRIEEYDGAETVYEPNDYAWITP